MAENHMALLAEAAKVGNVEFLVILIRSYPDLIWQRDEKYGSLFHIAISYRREKVFALIYEIGSLKDTMASFRDTNNNNMLHLAGYLAPSERLDIVPGAALQMQRELLWFKEIEKIVRPSFANMKNKEKVTPKDLFRHKHRALQEAGEKWMKDTANSCMLVATLIATVVFAATFTVPGGNKQETGIPIFLENNWFTVFFVSVAIALLSSSTSILIFLSVLTSRYTEDDFLKRLPRRLVFGLSTLFISIVSMVIAFSATCFLVYNSKSASVPTIIFAAAGIPISLFIGLQYDLWVDIIRSTYMSKFLFRNKHRLF
ncbi:hypothetical protein CJ030_MR3G007491 [Morella rubra]|uniref:PGG domain-containing protein n=1 Tax=Morella rubra TaxID=262757 RepID=A0A6A1WAE0_9ROSI|nr:hypothetical protein CJ030_MR3G007491 [Morella rubra]